MQWARILFRHSIASWLMLMHSFFFLPTSNARFVALDKGLKLEKKGLKDHFHSLKSASLKELGNKSGRLRKKQIATTNIKNFLIGRQERDTLFQIACEDGCSWSFQNSLLIRSFSSWFWGLVSALRLGMLKNQFN